MSMAKRLMTSLSTAALAATPAVRPVAAADIAAPSLHRPGWRLTWHDEFDGPTIDTSRWEVLTRMDNFNEEKQAYLPDQAAIVDGKLQITAADTPYRGKSYRSARLESWFEQAYGRFEVRAKIPATQGIWPAIWLLPRSEGWPDGGEIDIMENRGSEPTIVSSAYHFANRDGDHAYVTDAHRDRDEQGQPIAWHEGFHIYAAEWTPDEIRFYVDGFEHYRITGDDAPISGTPMSIVLNVAVGGWFDGDPDGSTVFPQAMLVDYVRVYQTPEPGTASVMALGTAAAALRRRRRPADEKAKP